MAKEKKVSKVTKVKRVIRVKKGETGSTGADGLNAYELAVIDGFPGSQQDWLESLKGEPGSGGGGTTGDVFDETEYYNKTDIDTKIAGHQSIEKAFNYFFHGNTPNNIFQSQNVNFNDTDRFKSLYDLWLRSSSCWKHTDRRHSSFQDCSRNSPGQYSIV